MKSLYKIIAVCTLLIGFASCQLIDIDSIEPQFKISETDAFSSPANAETALLGAYDQSIAHTSLFYSLPTYAHGMMGIEVDWGFASNIYMNNQVTADLVLDYQYGDLYTAINNLNYCLEGIGKLDADEFAGNRKAEMLGEVHFLRALQYFNLLRSFGQFWDLSSKYGVVIHETPNKSLVLKPRSTVQESYDLILADLDEAIQNAPDFSTATLASKKAAKAFKAKVLMYMGKYQEAITYCDDVINSGNFQLEPAYADIYTKTYESQEAILVNHWDPALNNPSSQRNFYMSFGFVLAGKSYVKISDGDPRQKTAISTNFFGDVTIAKYPNTGDKPGGFFYMRLAEVYLMKAECIARSGGNLDDAQAALDEVRARVGLPSTAAPDKAQLLEDIRTEKLLELTFEDGQPWFDLVRYSILGDIDITAIKPTITNQNQFILPIPGTSLKLSKGIVEQNPGY